MPLFSSVAPVGPPSPPVGVLVNSTVIGTGALFAASGLLLRNVDWSAAALPPPPTDDISAVVFVPTNCFNLASKSESE